MPKPIPVPPSPEKLRIKVQNCTTNPLFGGVCQHINEHDANLAEEGKPLGWVMETFGFSDDELVGDPNRVETACRVFEAIAFAMRLEAKRAELRIDPAFGQVKGWVRAAILADNNVHEEKAYRDSLRKAVKIAEAGLREIDLAMRFAVEILRWAEGGWQAVIEEFKREMGGINPATLTEHLGFSDQQVTLPETKADGKPQWGVLSLYDVAYRVTSDEAVLQNRAFRRAALSGFASFFRFAFGRTGSKHSELLDWADEIAKALYGDDAKLTYRPRGGNAPKTGTKAKNGRTAEKREADRQATMAAKGKSGKR